jgi:hypothetical protein
VVLTKTELIASLQNEVRILLHLAGKVEPSMLDYRPTPKQRSAMDLLRYLTMMGPALVNAAKTGTFDTDAWTKNETAAAQLDPDQVVVAIAALNQKYAAELGSMSEDFLRDEVELFGSKGSRGSFIVNNVLAGHAAYRTQLFLYLKSCGRAELGTMNLWGGMDAPAKAN